VGSSRSDILSGPIAICPLSASEEGGCSPNQRALGWRRNQVPWRRVNCRVLLFTYPTDSGKTGSPRSGSTVSCPMACSAFFLRQRYLKKLPFKQLTTLDEQGLIIKPHLRHLYRRSKNGRSSRQKFVARSRVACNQIEYEVEFTRGTRKCLAGGRGPQTQGFMNFSAVIVNGWRSE